MKVNRNDQAKILSLQEIAWLFDGKLRLVSDLKLFRLLSGLGNGRGMEATASLSLLSYVEGLPTDRDRALFGICLYTTARVNEACSLHTADVYGTDGRVRDLTTFRRATKGKQETRSVPVSPELRKLLKGYRSEWSVAECGAGDSESSGFPGKKVTRPQPSDRTSLKDTDREVLLVTSPNLESPSMLDEAQLTDPTLKCHEKVERYSIRGEVSPILNYDHSHVKKLATKA